MDIIETIRHRQKNSVNDSALPEHKPEMLYIGCIDARLDPVKDIGIPQGKALIHRTIGAIVAGLGEKGEPRNVSEAASVEFAVKVMNVKHIVVSGHTCCGGLEACLHGTGPELGFVNRYLEPLKKLRNSIVELFKDHKEQGRAMEEGAVRQSVENLLTYPFVADAVRKGQLQLHGWVIDTATKRIFEMDSKTKAFEPMAREEHRGREH